MLKQAWHAMFVGLTVICLTSCHRERELSPGEVGASRDAYQIVDVREMAEQRQDGVIEGALPLPTSVFGAQLSTVAAPDPRPLVLTCTTGERARRLARLYAAALGAREVKVMRGGMAAWTRAGLPVVRREQRWIGTRGGGGVGLLLEWDTRAGRPRVEWNLHVAFGPTGELLDTQPLRGDFLVSVDGVAPPSLEAVAARLEGVGPWRLEVERAGRRLQLTQRAQVAQAPPLGPGALARGSALDLTPQLLRAAGGEALAALRRAQAGSPVAARPGQAPLVVLLRQEPGLGAAAAGALGAALRGGVGAGPSSLAALLDRGALGAPSPPPECPPLPTHREGALSQLRAALEEAASSALEYRSHLPARTLAAGLPSFAGALYEDTTLEDVRDPALREAALSFVQGAPRGSAAPGLGDAARRLLCLAEPSRVEAMAALLRGAPGPEVNAAPPAQGGLLWAEHLPEGWLLIGGEGPNVYRGGAALILDLGGDDLYEGDHATSTLERPVSLVIDREGEDVYRAEGGPAQGVGVLGVGLLVDLGGDDHYQIGGEAQRLSSPSRCGPGQGAGLLGLGLLWDGAGDDTYQGGAWTQGAAAWGWGALADLGGVDRYEAGRISQGAGGPLGLGVLAERSGGDTYQLHGRPLTPMDGRAATWGGGQGFGIGLRRLFGGGVGVLWDGSGHDQYRGGTYTQGAGYYLGVGVLVDDEGDDLYRGQGFGQGAGIHQAVGVLLDRQGADGFEQGGGKVMGAGWDLGVGVLYDGGGVDRRALRDQGAGFAGQAGVGIFFDDQGPNVLRARGSTWAGKAGGDTYQGGRGARSIPLYVAGAQAPGEPPEQR